jgi:hypothetical protein
MSLTNFQAFHGVLGEILADYGNYSLTVIKGV